MMRAPNRDAARTTPPEFLRGRYGYMGEVGLLLFVALGREERAAVTQRDVNIDVFGP